MVMNDLLDPFLYLFLPITEDLIVADRSSFLEF